MGVVCVRYGTVCYMGSMQCGQCGVWGHNECSCKVVCWGASQQAYIVGLEEKSDALDPTSSSSLVGLQLSSWDGAKLFLEISFVSFLKTFLVVFLLLTVRNHPFHCICVS